jgi:hypothetical protein
MEEDSNTLILPCKRKNKAQGKGKVMSKLIWALFLGFPSQLMFECDSGSHVTSALPGWQEKQGQGRP